MLSQKRSDYDRKYRKEISRLLGAWEDCERRLESLSRYERAIENSLVRSLHELQRLQATRQGASVAVPGVLDVVVSAAEPRRFLEVGHKVPGRAETLAEPLALQEQSPGGVLSLGPVGKPVALAAGRAPPDVDDCATASTLRTSEPWPPATVAAGRPLEGNARRVVRLLARPGYGR